MFPLHVQPAAASTDALSLLLECHERIRRFCRLAVRLASEAAPEEDVREAARSVHRYFSTAFPLHVEDEERSLEPRLSPLAELSLRGALEQMSEAHRDIDALVDSLMPRWQRLLEAPAALLPELRADSEKLELLMLAHLELEERLIFPAARALLDAPALEGMAAEMRFRRRPPTPTGRNPLGGPGPR